MNERTNLGVDKTITSASNPLLGEWRDCLTSKGIKKHGTFLVSGRRAVGETLERFPKLAWNLLVCSERHVGPASGEADDDRKLIERARSLTAGNDPRFSVVALASKLFDELDVSGTRAPILVTRTPEIPAADLSVPARGLEILCALGDPSNVGALLRSAAAFGAGRVILLQESASPFHPKAVRAASASTLLTPLFRGPSIREIAGFAERATIDSPFLALDMHGESLESFVWPRSARLLLGEEGQGVPRSTGFHYLSIPMAKGVESLNATIAASIALYSYKTHH